MAYSASFNSLFEMPGLSAALTALGEIYTFNSLFEMRTLLSVLPIPTCISSFQFSI